MGKREAVDAALDGLRLLRRYRLWGGAHGVGSIEKAHAGWAWCCRDWVACSRTIHSGGERLKQEMGWLPWAYGQ